MKLPGLSQSTGLAWSGSSSESAPAAWFVILSPVRVLFGVLILSTMALIGAALAVVRHVRHHRAAARSQAEPHDEPL